MSTEIVARFYDNEERNFDGFHRNVVLENGQQFRVQCILVDDVKIYPLVLKDAKDYAKTYRLSIQGNTKFTSDTPEEFKSLYFGNYFVQKFMKGMTETEIALNIEIQKDPEEIYMPSNGITKEQIKNLREWCFENRDKLKIVFFDWDKTISVLEGFISFLGKIRDKEFICAHAEYILGGKERMQRIKRMFAFLVKHHVQIYILTNNQTLLYEREVPYFTALVQCVYPEFQVDQFISPPKKLRTKRDSLQDSQLWKHAPLYQQRKQSTWSQQDFKQQQQQQQQKQQKQQQQKQQSL